LTRELARILAGYICLHAAMAGTRMAAPLLALQLDYDKAAVGSLLALFALPQVFFALPAGRWADRRGVKIPVRASVAVATVGGAAAAIWPIYPVLCATAVCAGAGIAAASIALQRHVGRTAHTAQLKHAFAWLSMAPALANFIGPLVTGLAIDHAGYRAAFVLLAILPIVGWLSIRSTRESATGVAAAGTSGTPWNLWRQPAFRHLLILNWLTAASFDVHGFVVPVLGHERGLSASVIGTILGSFAIAAAMVRIAMPAMAARVREWKMIAAAMACAASFFFVYPFAHSAIAMALCSAAIGMSVGSVQPMVMSLLHQTTPSHRHGEAFAMRLLLINASSVAMPVVFGAAGGVIGVSSLFWLMGVAIGLGSRLSLTLRALAGSGIDVEHSIH
jgi:MFS family permease